MINTDDTLFIKYDELPDRSLMNDILYMGWYGNGYFALKQFADSYAYSATVLFDRFIEMKGRFAEQDYLGITIIFSYRHYCELIIKYFYVKYIAKVRSFSSFEEHQANIEEFFTANQHSISQSWSKTEPILRNLKKRIESEVSIDAISSYFSQMDQFDDSSMTMRYPVKKDMSPMIEGHVKINIVNLNEKMRELISSIEQLDMDIDNQITHLAPMEKMEQCFQCIKSNEDKFDTFVHIARAQERLENKNKEGFSIYQLLNPSDEKKEAIRQMGMQKDLDIAFAEMRKLSPADMVYEFLSMYLSGGIFFGAIIALFMRRKKK